MVPARGTCPVGAGSMQRGVQSAYAVDDAQAGGATGFEGACVGTRDTQQHAAAVPAAYGCNFKVSLTAFMRLCCAGLHHLQLPQPLRRPRCPSPPRRPGTQLLHSRLPSLPTTHRQRVRRWGFWHWSCCTRCSSAFQRPSLAQCTQHLYACP